MSDLFVMIAVFVLAFLIGYVLISRIPQRLQTPPAGLARAAAAAHASLARKDGARPRRDGGSWVTRFFRPQAGPGPNT